MKYNESQCCVELSVRELCTLALRGGDLDASRFSGVWGFDAARAGAEMHRRIQESAGGSYRPEVPLTNTTLSGGIYFTVSGRADGVMRDAEGRLTVDEIKCVRGSEFYAPPNRLFLAQLKCYAYFLAVQEELPEIGGRLTCCTLGTHKLRYLNYRLKTAELREFYLDLLARVQKRAGLVRLRKTELLPAASAAVFPYAELREGQERMIKECHAAIRGRKRLFLEAPTGIGKTMSALYPAVRALGSGLTEKIFYLTAKTSTGREAYRAAAELCRSGAKLRTVTIVSKEQMCVCPAGLFGTNTGKSHCNPRDCSFARGYYDRSEAALAELMEGGYGYPSRMIREMALRHKVCPYELSLDLSELCDIVICDYNYAFDPSVYFRRYFGAEAPSLPYTFLIDEAHNLVDRAREMYSCGLLRSDFAACFDALPPESGEFGQLLSSVLLAFDGVKKLCRDSMIRDAEGVEHGFWSGRSIPENFLRAMERFSREGERLMRREDGLPDSAEELFRRVRKYLTVSEFFDRGFLSCCEVNGGEIGVKICCLDPSPLMDSLLARASSAILFSATLTPVDYFCRMLGDAKGTRRVALPSPFPREHLCVAVADYLSLRLEDRSKNAARYVTLIAAAVSPQKGNYMVYFPSYAALEEVRKLFVRKYPGVETVVQKPHMSLRDREEFLSAFRDDEDSLRIGFCVLGGVFSEGVDLPGSRLIGTIIFGVGLPGISNERNMIRDYLEDEESRGYDYAYTFPGMNNVLQAAGRVIRREDDRGIVVLADDRYATPKYRALFPEHWQGVKYAGNAKSLAEIIRRFWHGPESCE